jgi:hypothetical protein
METSTRQKVVVVGFSLMLAGIGVLLAGLALSGCHPSDSTNDVMTIRKPSTAPQKPNTTVETVTPEEAQEAKLLIDKAIRAHGGPDNLARLRTYELRQSGTTDINGQPSATKREWQFAFPDRVHLSYDIAGQAPFDVGIDGDKAWLRSLGNIRELNSDDLSDARSELYLFYVLTLRPLRDEVFVLKPLPETRVFSRPAKSVKVMQKDHIQIELNFDAETNLLARAYLRPKKAGEITEQEILLSEYKPFEGIKLPTVWFERRGGVKVMEFKESDYRFPAQLPAKLFAMPD